MASKNLYYNNDETVQKIITQKELDEHNTSNDAHSEKFNNYTLSSPTGIWSAIAINPNYTPDIQSTEGFASMGTFICTYDATDCLSNQPSQYGILLNIPSVLKKSDDTGNAVTVTQLWFSQDGDIYSRVGTLANDIGMQKFTKILFTSDKFPARSGTSFNYTNVELGQLFYRTDKQNLYIYKEVTKTNSAGEEYTTTDWVSIFEGVNNAFNKLTDIYQQKLTFDTTPTSGSTNPVTSDGIYTAINSNQATIANSTTAGITKVYTTTGTKEDGTMTQAAITTAVNNACNQVIVAYPKISSDEYATSPSDGLPLFLVMDSDSSKCGVTAYPGNWKDYELYFIGPSINNHSVDTNYYVLREGIMKYSKDISTMGIIEGDSNTDYTAVRFSDGSTSTSALPTFILTPYGTGFVLYVDPKATLPFKYTTTINFMVRMMINPTNGTIMVF